MTFPFNPNVHIDGNDNVCAPPYNYIYFPNLLTRTIRESYQDAVCVYDCGLSG
jgi:hypothetical protein